MSKVLVCIRACWSPVVRGHELPRRANRPAPELEAIIGYFVNPVALRTQLEGGLTFREALQRVRDTVVGAQANAEVACRSAQHRGTKCSMRLCCFRGQMERHACIRHMTESAVEVLVTEAWRV